MIIIIETIMSVCRCVVCILIRHVSRASMFSALLLGLPLQRCQVAHGLLLWSWCLGKLRFEFLNLDILELRQDRR